MSPSTIAAFVPTKTYDDAGFNEIDLQNIADNTQNEWNQHVKSSSGDYGMTTDVHWDKMLDLSSYDTSTAEMTRSAAETELDLSYPSLVDNYDAILVRDNRTWPDYDGMADDTGRPTKAHPDSEVFAAGSDEKNVSICGQYAGYALEAHEVSHLYGGTHSRHETWGTSEYTVMGNKGDSQCSGGTTSDTRIRCGHYNSCTVDDIRYYMDHWAGYGYF